jgi:signal transduction histidine kinase
MRIRRSQQHLLGIINDILNFSRVDAGQITYDLAAVPVNAVLESVVQMMASLAESKGLAFEMTRCPPDATVWADRSKLEQILINLLSNAVKFTPRSGRITLSCAHAGAHTVQLTVADTGTGIPEDQLERIFEPFVQVGRSLIDTPEGTGLGLSISRDLARAMGGELRVASTVGKGSAFTLTLPVEARGAPESPAAPRKS